MLARTSDFINLSRWAAAFVVVASHLRQLIMCDYENVRAPGLLTKAFYFITQMGHEAVMVFFIISGYLIGGAAIMRYKERGFNLTYYASHRTARIYTAFLPALVIFGLFDIIGSQLLERSGLYSEALGIASLHRAPTESLRLTDMIGNLAMLQYGIVQPFGSNGPLWSLSYEWWYYVIFGCAFVAITRPIVGGVALLMLAALLPPMLLAYGLIWLLGAVTGVYITRGYRLPPLWITMPLFALSLVGARFTHMSLYEDAFSDNRFFIDFVVGLTFAMVLLSYHRPGRETLFPALHKRLADFSYSLYLIHFPLMLFAVASLYGFAGIDFLEQPSFKSSAYYGIMLMFLIMSAWLFSRATEAKTESVRQWFLWLMQRRFIA